MEKPSFIFNRDDWSFEPFGMTVNPEGSLLDEIPDVREESTTIPGQDGEIPLEITYQPRPFVFVLRSRDGMSNQEKQDLKDKIYSAFNEARKEACSLLFLTTRRTYDVRATGRPEIVQEWPGWFEMRFPLKAYDPYGYETFERKKRGTFSLTNNGNEYADTTISISGAVTNPSFVADHKRYFYEGTIPVGSTLVVDSKMQHAYIENAAGARTSAIQGWCGGQPNFFTIPPKSIVRVVADFSVKIVHRNKWI